MHSSCCLEYEIRGPKHKIHHLVYVQQFQCKGRQFQTWGDTLLLRGVDQTPNTTTSHDGPSWKNSQSYINWFEHVFITFIYLSHTDIEKNDKLWWLKGKYNYLSCQQNNKDAWLLLIDVTNIVQLRRTFRCYKMCMWTILVCIQGLALISHLDKFCTSAFISFCVVIWNTVFQKLGFIRCPIPWVGVGSDG